MKRLLLGISVVALMMTTSCGNKAEQDRIAQLEAEIAKLKGEEYNESSSFSSSKERDYSSEGYNDYSSSEKVSSEPQIFSSYVGTYKFTDESNKTWVLSLNSDKTAQIKSGDELHYGSWEDHEMINTMYIKFDYDDAPIVYFPLGGERGTMMAISKDGFIYKDMDAKDAKNPRKRLPIKKLNKKMI